MKNMILGWYVVNNILTCRTVFSLAVLKPSSHTAPKTKTNTAFCFNYLITSSNCHILFTFWNNAVSYTQLQKEILFHSNAIQRKKLVHLDRHRSALHLPWIICFVHLLSIISIFPLSAACKYSRIFMSKMEINGWNHLYSFAARDTLSA